VRSQLCNSADSWGSSTEFGCGKLNIAAALGISIPPITNLSIGASNYTWNFGNGSSTGGRSSGAKACSPANPPSQERVTIKLPK